MADPIKVSLTENRSDEVIWRAAYMAAITGLSMRGEAPDRVAHQAAMIADAALVVYHKEWVAGPFGPPRRITSRSPAIDPLAEPTRPIGATD